LPASRAYGHSPRPMTSARTCGTRTRSSTRSSLTSGRPARPTLAEPDRPILLDTDVVSLLMRGSLDPARSGLRAYGWCVSYITVGELAKGAEMARWNLRRWTDLADWLGH